MLRPLFCVGFVLGSCFVVYTLRVASRSAIITAGCFTLSFDVMWPKVFCVSSSNYRGLVCTV